MTLSVLFIDMNSYFASVEQQMRPELRSRPVAVVPSHVGSTCCIAASKEAKARGVRTGTLVGEAQRLCPGLICVRARPRLYIEVHHAILREVDTVIPVERICSIDEFYCRLMKGEREPHQAVAIAERIKRVLAERLGPCLTCSVGIAPNRFLAKVASDMQKPDGLVVIERKDLPHALNHLQLDDLPGIGSRMRRRLEARGIRAVAQLTALSQSDMGAAWHSVVGRRWWSWLRGDETPEIETLRRSVGHSRVLGTSLRNDEAARAVAVRLLHKAAARARHLAHAPRRLALSMEVGHRRGEGLSWTGEARIPHDTTDTLELVRIFSDLWSRRPPGPPMYVAVTLQDLVPRAVASAPLFVGERRREQLSEAIDRLDRKYGRNTVYTASMHAARDTTVGGIAFGSIPELDLPDSVDSGEASRPPGSSSGRTPRGSGLAPGPGQHGRPPVHRSGSSG